MSCKSSFYMDSIDHSEKIVYFTDMDVGRSMTNDAENVVEYSNLQYPGYRVMYQDTMKNWDEMVHENGVFVGFKPGKHPPLY